MSVFNILVMGGYGSFGKWISMALAEDPLINVVIAGRDGDKAEKLASSIGNKIKPCSIKGLALNAMSPSLALVLKKENIHTVIHTSGPFQTQSYHVANACINAGCHYIDLADSREFVLSTAQLHDNAVQSNVTIISGASTVPGLSSAVIQQYFPEFNQLESIEYSIVPGNKAPKGYATIKSILSYTGHPFLRWENNTWKIAYGWQDLKIHDYGNDLGKKWVASCNIPDLELFPKIYKGVKHVKFYAGLELNILHFSLWLMSWISRAKLVENWAKYAGPITAMSGWFEKFGSNIGGMLIKLNGTDIHNNKKSITWRLIAKDGHGPKIPTIAAVIIAKKLARKEINSPGAYVCAEMITLHEFSQEIEDLGLSLTQEVF